MNQEHLRPVRTGEEMNWKAIEQYIRLHIPDLDDEPMQVSQFTAGYSNLTYSIRIGKWDAVLRRPPFGQIPPKSHDMEREYRILQKIHPVFPLAPKPYLYGDDPAIMDKHFYVMEKRTGVVLDDHIPAEYENDPHVGRIASETVVDTLVQLHAIDYQKAGLSEIGRPEGYLERQVHGWVKRYHQVKTDEIAAAEEIETWLITNIPSSPAPTIVHNDFKLNNMMLSSEDPSRAVAVFDWEMCTIGDPLTDLGSTLAYWTEEGEAKTGLSSITASPGFFKRTEIIEQYARKSGRDLSNMDYYLTFAFYKIAVILQQIYYRWKQGQSADERFSRLSVGIRNLMEQAARAKRKELLKGSI